MSKALADLIVVLASVSERSCSIGQTYSGYGSTVVDGPGQSICPWALAVVAAVAQAGQPQELVSRSAIADASSGARR